MGVRLHRHVGEMRTEMNNPPVTGTRERRPLLADELKELRAELAALKERIATLETKVP